MSDHDKALADAFDGQAARFERAPVQSDPERLERLIRAADLPPTASSSTRDAGRGWSVRPCSMPGTASSGSTSPPR